MGMSNDEIEAMMNVNADSINKEPEEKKEELEGFSISQDAMDSLLSNFVSEEIGSNESLMDEIHEAILDSGRLSLMQWVSLREKLREIEELVPHIDLLIKLKSKAENKRTDF